MALKTGVCNNERERENELCRRHTYIFINIQNIPHTHIHWCLVRKENWYHIRIVFICWINITYMEVFGKSIHGNHLRFTSFWNNELFTEFNKWMSFSKFFFLASYQVRTYMYKVFHLAPVKRAAIQDQLHTRTHLTNHGKSITFAFCWHFFLYFFFVFFKTV